MNNLIVFILFFIGCKQQRPVSKQLDISQKGISTYTVISGNQKFEHLRLCFEGELGETFLTIYDKKIKFRGNYIVIEEMTLEEYEGKINGRTEGYTEIN